MVALPGGLVAVPGPRDVRRGDLVQGAAPGASRPQGACPVGGPVLGEPTSRADTGLVGLFGGRRPAAGGTGGRVWPRRLGWGGVVQSPEKRTRGARCADAGVEGRVLRAAIQRAGRGRGVWPAADGVWKGLRPLSAIPWYGAGGRALGAGATPGSRTPGRPCANLRKVAGGAPAGVEPKDKPSRPAGVVRGRGRHRAATVRRTSGSAGGPLYRLCPSRARARGVHEGPATE